MNFLLQWLNRFGLSSARWPEEVGLHLDELPFIPPEKSTPLVAFLFGELPPLLLACGDDETALLAEAYGWCCFAFWQCESAFPALVEDYASYLRSALLKSPPERDPGAALLARIIVDSKVEDGHCGFNKLKLADPATIRESETLNHEGRYEDYLKTSQKYDEYVNYLEQSVEFDADWTAIKTAFPTFAANWDIVRRSPIPERNWHQSPAAQFETDRQRFQAIFDFFCWKYFLWGMEGDRPLLLKTSVVVTPHGTQIFIPGYLSFDLRRDLDLPRINRLHRARGVPRQGFKMSSRRDYLADLSRKARAADAEAREKGLRGEDRYRYIRDKIEYTVTDDGHRQLRRLLKYATRKKPDKQFGSP